MAYERNDMSGSLFRNDNKEHDKQPDWTGNIKINGKTYRLAAWDTTSQGGVDYLSIKASDPEEYRRQQGQRQGTKPPERRLSNEELLKRREQMRGRPVNSEFDFDQDDIPF